jgi:hypothetical protein
MKHYYKIYKNFLNKKECDYLSNWIIDNKNNSFFKNANMGGIRFTTRYSDDFIFPKKAYKIQKKIIKEFKLNNFLISNFKDGMVASYASPGDTCYDHKDPVWKENTITLHCNIKLSNNEGGNPIIANEKIYLEKGDMWSYPVSEVMHGSDLVTGTIPRTMWVFGFCITQKDYDRLF